MATNYPDALDDNSTLPSDRVTGDVIPADDKNVASEAIIALETKVGIDDSADTTTLDYRVGALEDAPGGGAAEDVTFTPGTGIGATLSTDVQAALDELGAEFRDAIFLYHEGVRSTETASNNATRINDVLGDALDRVVVLPYGALDYDSTILLNQGQYLIGHGTGDTLTYATILNYTGADTTNGMQMATTNLSRVWLQGFRLIDDRTTPSAGTGIYLSRAKNQVVIENVMAAGFPTGSFYVGATSGQTTEVVSLKRLWTGSLGIGVMLERIDNQAVLESISGDAQGAATMTALIKVDNISAGQGAVSIKGAKLETNQGCHLLQIGSGFQSVIDGDGLVLRGATAGAGGDVVRIESTVGAYTFRSLGSMIYAGGGAAAANLINDSAESITYGNGKRLAGLWHKTKDTSHLGTQLLSNVARSVKAVSASTTLGPTHDVVLVTTGASDRTMTLPAAASSRGMAYTVKKVDSGSGDVIIDANASETIDGATTVTMTDQYDERTIVCDATGWHIVGTGPGPLSDHLADTGDAHDASAVSVLDSGNNFTGTDVETALAELAAVSGGPHDHDEDDLIPDTVEVDESLGIGATGQVQGALYRKFVADEAIAVGDVLVADTSSAARVMKSSSTTAQLPIGVAMDVASGAGDTIRVAMLGVCQVMVDTGATTALGTLLAITGSGRATTTATISHVNSRPFLGVALEASASGTNRLVWAHINPAWTPAASAAPSSVDYLVGTASSDLSAEIAVGTTPGGELGNTWASPTVDATHSGSAHHDAITIGADTEHSLSGQVLSGVDGTTSQKGHLTIGATTPLAVGTAAAGAATTEAAGKNHIHATGAGTPSTQAFGDAAATGTGPAASMTDHKHAMPADPTTAHAAAADPHTGYVLESLLDVKGDLIAASADNTPAKLTAGANDTILMADSAQTAGLKWVASQTPSTQAFSDAAAEGTADTYARGDHKHAMPASPSASVTTLSIDKWIVG